MAPPKAGFSGAVVDAMLWSFSCDRLFPLAGDVRGEGDPEERVALGGRNRRIDRGRDEALDDRAQRQLPRRGRPAEALRRLSEIASRAR
jgi:hypothetical protein